VAGGSFGDFWAQYGSTLDKVFVYALGITAFTLVSLFFYKMLSRRSIFHSGEQEGVVATPSRHVLHVLVFPLVSFGFFLMLAAAFLFISGTAGSGGVFITESKDLFTIAMAVVLSVRILAYINQEASEEVGKIMPLGLLGVFLLTNPDTTLKAAIDRMGDLFRLWPIILVVFAAIVIVEYLLFAVAMVVRAAQTPKRARPKAAPRPAVQQRPAQPRR
jgi:hypothetical protein